MIKLNRSLAHLRLGCFDKSITDAGRLTQDVQKSEKGYYRAARSFYELRRFGECHETLKDLLSQYPDCEAAKKELFRSERRLQEQEDGDYDFRIMYEAARETPPCLDQATHVGPVKIQASEGCGRGLFTTRAVAAGELLLCEKAFTHCFAAQEANEDSSKVKSRTTMLMHTHSNRAVMGAQADLITATVQKLYRNPSLLPAFVSLHHGDYIPVKEAEVDELPIIDTSVCSFFRRNKGKANSHQVPYHRNHKTQCLWLSQDVFAFHLYRDCVEGGIQSPSHNWHVHHSFLHQS